ncbi:MAG TPA: hypothetical protein VMZ92_02440, partial [Planctomycetota bacterium]|nr:hypothetical protein [Planctomycetota bacterium]
GLLDRRAGDLLRSAMYADAVKGLPAQRSGVMVISAAEAMRLILGRLVGAAGDEGNPLEGFEFEKASGIGMSYGPVQGGVAVYLNVPMQEMQNVKALLEKLGPMGPRPGGRRRGGPAGGGRRVREAPAQ